MYLHARAIYTIYNTLPHPECPLKKRKKKREGKRDEYEGNAIVVRECRVALHTLSRYTMRALACRKLARSFVATLLSRSTSPVIFSFSGF